jgi:molybdopterin-guanine dinucleotide biosynthesis protein A
MSIKEPKTGIILAGGQSRRMGVEKGLVEFLGRPLIEWAVSVIRESCSEILISSNSSCYDYLGYKVVKDIENDSGPMGGIYSCLLESKNSINLVLSCDMPFVKPDIFSFLAKQIRDARICVPWYEGDHFEPLCGIYLKASLPDMKTFMDAKNYKLPELFSKTSFSAASITAIHPPLPEYYFMNINSPADLALAERITRH